LGGDHAPVLGTGETAPWILCSVLGLSLQEGHRGAGACPEEGKEAGEGSREQVLQGAAEGTGIAWCGEEKAEGRPYCSLQLPERRL